MILLAVLAGGMVMAPSVPALRRIGEVAVPGRALTQTMVAERQQVATATGERPIPSRDFQTSDPRNLTVRRGAQIKIEQVLPPSPESARK